MRTTNFRNYNECLQFCKTWSASTQKCRAFTYDINGGKCYLKAQLGDVHPIAGFANMIFSRQCELAPECEGTLFLNMFSRFRSGTHLFCTSNIFIYSTFSVLRLAYFKLCTSTFCKSGFLIGRAVQFWSK